MLTDRADVLVHSRGNAAKNRLLWTPPPPTPAPAAAGTSGSDDKLAPPQTPPPGRAGVMPLDWCAPDVSEAAASVLAAMGGRVDFVLASDRCGMRVGGVALSKHTPSHLSLLTYYHASPPSYPASTPTRAAARQTRGALSRRARCVYALCVAFGTCVAVSCQFTSNTSAQPLHNIPPARTCKKNRRSAARRRACS